MLESRRLRHFLTIFELGSIGQAAEKLLLTQPALSKSIRQLEDELGIRLFDRTPLGVVPTVFGNALALHAKAIQAQVRQAEAQISSLRGMAKGVVTIGVGPSVAAKLMPLVAVSLQKLHPAIELSVNEGLVDELIPALRRGELKLAIGAWPPVTDPAFATEILHTDLCQLWVRQDHPLLGRRLELFELVDHPWASPPASQRWRQEMEEQFFARGLSPPKPMIVSNSANFLKTVVRGSDYLALLPSQLVHDSDGLVALDAAFDPLRPEVNLVYKPRALADPPVLEVVQVLRALAAEAKLPADA